MNWIKNNLLLVSGYAIMALVSVCAIMFTLWQGAQRELHDARELARAQSQIIELQSQISEHENHVDRVVEHITERVMEAPNANVIVPPDVASAWADGINSLRNDEGGTDKRHEDMPGPTSTNAAGRDTNDRTTGSNVTATGSSVSKMQLSSRASSKTIRG